MTARLERLCALLERGAVWLAGLGAAIILVQMAWISYGVAARYVFNAPDRMVTEATALLLFPVAFLGLAYALYDDAYPKVTMLIDRLPPRARRVVDVVNMAIMLAVGAFFALAAVDATVRAYQSGAASEILLWPRYLFWTPGAVALLAFALYATVRLALLLARPIGER